MWRRKVEERQPFSVELEQAGIRYRPFVFTTYGRPHPAASEALIHISKIAARRKGWTAKAVEKRFRAAIGTVLARRAARMSLSTWPQDEHEVHLDLSKHFDDEPGAQNHVRPAATNAADAASPATDEVVTLLELRGGTHAAAARDIRLQR
jgi:hypothetical protein